MKVDSTDPGAGTVPVRVIEYTLKGVPGAEPVYRLITTILDAQAAPAPELAALYHERWEAETTLCEIKVRLPGRRPAQPLGRAGLAGTLRPRPDPFRPARPDA
jgi:hypothetical protein